MKINTFVILFTLLSLILSLDVKSFAEEESQAEAIFANASFSVKCMLVNKFKVYDLTKMAKSKFEDGVKDYNISIGGERVFYNFCYDLDKDIRCNKDKALQVLGKTSSTCRPLADSIGTGNQWKLSDNIIEIQLNALPNSTEVVKYRIQCDNTTKSSHVYISGKSYYRKSLNGKKETLLYFKSPHACPLYDFYTFWQFIDENQGIFAVIIILIGLFECIFGYKLLVPTSFIITCIGVIVIVAILFFQYILPPGLDDWVIWVILLLSLVVGLVAGFFVAKLKDKGLALVAGGVAGFFLGEFLFNLFGNRFGENLQAVHIAFIVVSILIMVCLALVLSKIMIIFSTSLIGSYAVVRGISLFVGGFPNEFTVIDLAKAGETGQLADLLDWEMYSYLIGIVLLTALSMFLQIRINRRGGGSINVNSVEGGLFG